MLDPGQGLVARGLAPDPSGRAAGPASSSATPIVPPDAVDLAARAVAGCADSFARLVTPHEGSLYRFLVLRSGNAADAEELAQETLLRAWTHLARYDAGRPFAPWLFTIAHRLASSLHRRRGRRPADELPDELRDPRPDPSQRTQAREQRGRLWALAARVLNADQCTALWLRYAEDLPAEEIGRVLERSAPAVRVLLVRARRSLARHLAATPESFRDATPARPEPNP